MKRSEWLKKQAKPIPPKPFAKDLPSFVCSVCGHVTQTWGDFCAHMKKSDDIYVKQRAIGIAVENPNGDLFTLDSVSNMTQQEYSIRLDEASRRLDRARQDRERMAAQAMRGIR